MWLNGDEDQGPVPFGLAVADMLAGAAAAQGILAGLVRRGVTGKGSHVQTSLLEALVDFQFEVLTTHLNDGRRPPKRSNFRSAHAYLSAPYGVYPASDGYLAIAMTPIGKLADLLGIDELAPYRDQPSSWFTARDEIKKIIAERIATRTIDEWLADPRAGRHLVRQGAVVERDDGERRLQGARHAADGRARGRRLDPDDALADPRQRQAGQGDARRTAHRRAQRGHPQGVRLVSSVMLKGMTWSHPRGYDPMVACSAIWKEKTGVEIAWDKRSLQDFESFPSRIWRAPTI